jgi:hypothetical protein
MAETIGKKTSNTATKTAAVKAVAANVKPAPKKVATKAVAAAAKPAPKKTVAKAPAPAITPAAKKPVAAKKPAAAKATPTKRTAKSSSVVMVVTDEQRYRMVAEAAYYRAESNQFKSDSVRDWIEAENDIATLLSGSK